MGARVDILVRMPLPRFLTRLVEFHYENAIEEFSFATIILCRSSAVDVEILQG
ncbi:unnamed protein product [Periconia digitata]|uniref:Uncharacterized protein n=1 Tax=Periconia digitata TaxID=1303443 RepID=A0A9W4UXY8_9PLEO|nr:unnamed protein product [Periconia digitata]